MKRRFFYLVCVLLFFLSLLSAFPSKLFFSDLNVNLSLQYFFFTLVLSALAVLLKLYKALPILTLSLFFLTWTVYSAYVEPQKKREASLNQDKNKGGLPLKIFQINSLVTNTKGALDFVSYIEKNDFDIVVVFEMNNYWQMALSSLKKSHPYSFFYVKSLKYSHLGFITKIKFNEMSTIETPSGMPFFYLNMDIGSKNYDFYFLHPHSPSLPSSFNKRNAYMSAFLNYYKANDNSVVIGDMNNTLFSSYTKETLEKTALFPVNASNPLLLTWPSAFPLFGIDQIYIASGINYADIRLGPSFYSDHRSLETTLLISD